MKYRWEIVFEKVVERNMYYVEKELAITAMKKAAAEEEGLLGYGRVIMMTLQREDGEWECLPD